MDYLLDIRNAFNQTYVKSQFVFDNGLIHETVVDVGFRLHGFSTRICNKKSWAIAFDDFGHKSREWYSMTDMKLNGERTDPTMTREPMSFDVYRSLNIPTSRGSYVELWVNDVHHGLYFMFEDVDTIFLHSRLGSHKGQLYKCRSGASLDYLGPDPATYRDLTSPYLNQTWHKYELDSSPQTGDYDDIVSLVTAINATSDDAFIAQLDARFDTDLFVRSMIVEILLAQVDAYAYNGNNFRLYHHTKTGKVEWLPFDFDVSQGSCVEFPKDPIDPWVRDWANQDIYSYGSFSGQSVCGGIRPLITRMMRVPFYRTQLTEYFRRMLFNGGPLDVDPSIVPSGCATGQLSDDDAPLFRRMFQHKALIAHPHARDVWLQQVDNTWAASEFETGFCHPVAHIIPKGHVTDTIIRWGLVQYYLDRVASARKQLDP